MENYSREGQTLQFIIERTLAKSPLSVDIVKRNFVGSQTVETTSGGTFTISLTSAISVRMRIIGNTC